MGFTAAFLRPGEEAGRSSLGRQQLPFVGLDHSFYNNGVVTNNGRSPFWPGFLSDKEKCSVWLPPRSGAPNGI